MNPKKECNLSLSDRAVWMLSRAMLVMAASILAAMMFLIVSDVTGRYVFNHPFRGTLEISEFLMVAVVFLSIAGTMHVGRHVSIRMLVDRLPEKSQALVDSLVLLVSIALFAAMAWKSGVRAVDVLNQGWYSDLLRIPAWPFRMLVAVGAFLMCLELIVLFLKRVTAIFTRR